MDDLWSRIPSGTIILFKKQHRFISTIISLATSSEWTHCGMVLNEGENVSILESMLNPGKLNIERMDGVTLSDLKRRLEVTRHPVKFLVMKGLPENAGTMIRQWYERNRSKKFDRKFFITYFSKVDPREEFFCSELVAEVLKFLGVVRREVQTHRIDPGDFEEILRDPEALREGCELKESIEWNTEGRAQRQYAPYIMFLEARCELFGVCPTLSRAILRPPSRSEISKFSEFYGRVIGAGSPRKSLEVLLRGYPQEPEKKKSIQ